MGLDAMTFVFWMLSFKSTFSLSSFTFIKRLFSSSSLSAITVVWTAYMRLLIFLLAILITVYIYGGCSLWGHKRVGHDWMTKQELQTTIRKQKVTWKGKRDLKMLLIWLWRWRKSHEPSNTCSSRSWKMQGNIYHWGSPKSPYIILTATWQLVPAGIQADTSSRSNGEP